MSGRADLLLALDWASATPAGSVRHRDHLFARAADLARDPLPEALRARLASARPGETVTVPIAFEELVTHQGAAAALPRDAFAGRRADGSPIVPKAGRFYPAPWFPEADRRGWLPAVRCVAAAATGLTVDPGHPLQGYDLMLSATLVGRLDSADDRMPMDWLAELAAGPGMQACWAGQATDFAEAGAYDRPDDAPDPGFYAPPRITAHLDGRAQRVLGAVYKAVLPEEGRVLDLMSSVHSNLAPDQELGALIGLGLNGQELSENPRLDGAVLADLNAGRAMPFADGSFDGAICTVSIDYLTDPVAVLGEVARVLRPGAPFAVTYSNRWFPLKVTRLWTELHPFEQQALVVSYFEASGGFADLETASYRGYPRPMDDPYYRQITTADPVFAVIGRRA